MKEIDDKITRIKSMYNACAKNFNKYLSDHDMKAYNKRSMEIKKMYGGETDIVNLLWWFAPKVQTIHDEWRKEHGESIR